jgi:hypothetical protein
LDQDAPDPQFDAMTARLLRREDLRRAAEELNTTTGPGLEAVLARISDEVTAKAAARVAARVAAASGKTHGRRDACPACPQAAGSRMSSHAA